MFLFDSNGMTQNFNNGKSECMSDLRGEGAVQLKDNIFNADDAYILYVDFLPTISIREISN